MPRDPWEEDDLRPGSFDQEDDADSRRTFRRQAIGLTLAFGVLFAGVYLAFWWSGAAVRFGALRVTDRAAPAWHVSGEVRDAVTRKPVPWARVEDDPSGQPPFFRTDADQFGSFDLLTLPEAHRVRVSAPGYRSTTVPVSRAWFLWWPRGKEYQHIDLFPDESSPIQY